MSYGGVMKKRFRFNRLFSHLCIVIPTLSCIYSTSWADNSSQLLANDTQNLKQVSQTLIQNGKVKEADLSKGMKAALERRNLLLKMLQTNKEK